MKKNVPLGRHCQLFSPPVKCLLMLKIAVLLILFSVSHVYANDDDVDAKISGKVVGDSAQPLSGVAVRVKGTNIGTVTGSDGLFTIDAAADAVLQISYVGYEDKEVPVAGQSVINIQLASANKQLEQVVVVGYGTQKKKDITSAISTVDTKDINKRPIVSTAEVMAGKTPGVQVVQPSGKPGSDFSVRIRGIASVFGNSQPLYVVDGVVTYDTKAIDAGNIESISILKDASAAGIYGAAGSTNGVVLITTKQGSKGKAKIDVNAYTGIQQIVKKLDVLNSDQLIDLLNEEKANAGEPPVSIPPDLQGVDNNWQDIVYHHAPMTGVNVGFSTGGENGTYYLGLGYLNQDGIVIESNFIRYSATVNIEQNLNKWLTAGAHINYNRTYSKDVPDNARVNQGGVVLTALSTPPFVPKYNADGTFGLNPFQAWENPLASIEGPYNKTTADNILGDAHVQIKLPYNLKYRSQFGISLYSSNYDYFLDPYRTQYGRSKQGIGQNNTSEIFRYIWDNTLTYDKAWDKHSINAVAGSSASDQNESYGYQYGEGFPNGSVRTLNAATTNKQISTTKQEWSLLSYFGRVNYSYNNKYLFTASFRADASSRFGTENQWGYFPAFSAGWRISREEFMQNVTLINDLKLRGGWGVTGNLPPVYYPSYSKISTGYNYSFGGVISPGAIPDQEIGNPDLIWEKTQQFNIGFDLAILKSRISLTADYYIKKTRDLIFQENVPMSTGLGYRYANAPGFAQNKGFEFGITGNIFTEKDFLWTSSLNMSFNKNVVQDLDSGRIIYAGSIPERDYVTVVKEGLPLGAFWGYIAEGVDPQTGNMKFKDLNGDNVIDPDHDRTYLGSGLPKFTFGFTNDLTYKNFNLNFLIDGVVGNKVFNGTRIETEGMFQVNNATTDVLRRWKKAGDVTDIPIAIFGDPAPANSQPNSSISSRFLEDGSFLRFRVITLSYNLNNYNWIKNIGITGLRFYVTFQNWITISDYKGYQPEVNRDGTDPISQGIDYGTYPQAKVTTFGVNVSL